MKERVSSAYRKQLINKARAKVDGMPVWRLDAGGQPFTTIHELAACLDEIDALRAKCDALEMVNEA